MTALGVLLACSSPAATLNTGALDGGGGTSTAASYAVTASLGGITGDASGGSVSNSSGGTVTQPSVKSLSVNAAPGSINQSGTSQLSGTAAMDDNSVTVLSATDITWSVVSYPFQSLNSSGLLTAVANVYSVATGTVNGSYIGVAGSTTVQVNGPYASSTIPDSWFNQYFGAAPNPNAAPDVDRFGTGQNNLFKYLAGLDPTNAASMFKLRIAAVTNQPTWKNLIFTPRYDGRTYTPMYRTNLLTGSWVALTNTNTSDNAATRTITDLGATQPQKFYRIQISIP
jgi:hypothetical protein